MFDWLTRLLGRKPHRPTGNSANAAQSLRLQLDERARAVERLSGDLERLRREQDARVEERVASQLERLMGDLAGPLSQLHTQNHLVANKGVNLSASDVLAVARQIERIAAGHGLTLECAPGETASFDPDRHEALSSSAAPSPGETVIVRFAGAAFNGRVVHKAGVEKEVS